MLVVWLHCVLVVLDLQCVGSAVPSDVGGAVQLCNVGVVLAKCCWYNPCCVMAVQSLLCVGESVIVLYWCCCPCSKLAVKSLLYVGGVASWCVSGAVLAMCW